MKNYTLFAITAVTLLFTSCTNAQTGTAKNVLPATEFAEKIKALPAAPVLDVRTPGEFEKGHLPNAKNYDWNGGMFEQQIASLDRSQPVFVYCLSGGRSAAAAANMRASGFKQVYELEGGIIKWREANLPESTGTTTLQD